MLRGMDDLEDNNQLFSRFLVPIYTPTSQIWAFLLLCIRRLQIVVCWSDSACHQYLKIRVLDNTAMPIHLPIVCGCLCGTIAKLSTMTEAYFLQHLTASLSISSQSCLPVHSHPCSLLVLSGFPTILPFLVGKLENFLLIYLHFPGYQYFWTPFHIFLSHSDIFICEASWPLSIKYFVIFLSSL